MQRPSPLQFHQLLFNWKAKQNRANFNCCHYYTKNKQNKELFSSLYSIAIWGANKILFHFLLPLLDNAEVKQAFLFFCSSTFVAGQLDGMSGYYRLGAVWVPSHTLDHMLFISWNLSSSVLRSQGHRSLPPSVKNAQAIVTSKEKLPWRRGTVSKIEENKIQKSSKTECSVFSVPN